MKQNVPYNNIYFCGECYFSHDLENFVKEKINCNVVNLSVGSGSTDTFLTILKYKKHFDPGVFLLGGSVHDKWGWNEGKTLEEIYNWFNSSLYDSNLVLCLTGPFDETDNQNYDHRIINDQKKMFAEKNKIDCLDLRIKTQHVMNDKIHFNLDGKKTFHEKILNFLVGYKPRPINPIVKLINKKTTELQVFPCKRLTIIHDHNNNLLDIYNNDKIVKKLTPTRLSSEHKDRTSFIDRTLVSNFVKLEEGLIKFSEPVFIHATLTHF